MDSGQKPKPRYSRRGYQRSCPEAAEAGPRGWMSLGSAPPVSPSSALCADGRTRVAAQAGRVLDGLRAAEDKARAAWVTPGAVREALTARGFETR